MADIEEVLGRIKEAKNLKTDTELASLLGVKPNTISGWRARKSVPYDLIVSICEKENLDLDWILAGKEPLSEIPGSFVPEFEPVPVYSLAGAGTPKELFSGQPLFFIPVVKQMFKRGMNALIVAGQSKEPSIMDGAFALVIPGPQEVIDGKVYVVYLRDNGIVLKRLFRGAGKIILRSDNPTFPDIDVDPRDIEIQGRVFGVSQEL